MELVDQEDLVVEEDVIVMTQELVMQVDLLYLKVILEEMVVHLEVELEVVVEPQLQEQRAPEAVQEEQEHPMQLQEQTQHMLEVVVDPETLEQVVATGQPHLLCAHLYDIAVGFSTFYEQCPVLSASAPLRDQRLVLAGLTEQTLTTGLGLLGIETLDRM